MLMHGLWFKLFSFQLAHLIRITLTYTFKNILVWRNDRQRRKERKRERVFVYERGRNRERGGGGLWLQLYTREHKRTICELWSVTSAHRRETFRQESLARKNRQLASWDPWRHQYRRETFRRESLARKNRQLASWDPWRQQYRRETFRRSFLSAHSLEHDLWRQLLLLLLLLLY